MSFRIAISGLILIVFTAIGSYFAGLLPAVADEPAAKPHTTASKPETSSFPAGPYALPFQGRLTDEKGAALLDGLYDVTFGLYFEEVNGTAGVVCTQKNVKISSDGLLDTEINLSDDPNFKPQIIDGRVLYLGVRVDKAGTEPQPRPEMSPRIRILPVLFAKNAGRFANHEWDEIEFRLRRLERLTHQTTDPEPEPNPPCYPSTMDSLDYRNGFMKKRGLPLDGAAAPPAGEGVK